MNIYEKIKLLAKERRLSIAQIERNLDLSNGSVSKWAVSKPNSEPLSQVANYLNVTTDYLLGLKSYEEIKNKMALKDFEDVSFPYYRIDITGLTEDEVQEVRNRLAFAEQVALQEVRAKNKKEREG